MQILRTPPWLRMLQIVLGSISVLLAAIILFVPGSSISTTVLILSITLLLIGIERICFGVVRTTAASMTTTSTTTTITAGSSSSYNEAIKVQLFKNREYCARTFDHRPINCAYGVSSI